MTGQPNAVRHGPVPGPCTDTTTPKAAPVPVALDAALQASRARRVVPKWSPGGDHWQ